MKLVLFIIAIISFCISYFVWLTRNIHIFQINFYKVKPQIKWIIKNIKKIVIIDILFVICGICAIFGDIGSIIFSLLMLIATFILKEKDIKKPLVYTARVKRMIITAYILNIVIGVITYMLTKNYNMTIIILAYIDVFVPFIVLFVNLLNIPINNIISRYYINDAKKIIKQMPNLIVIGVTGSYGKTSVKNFLYKCLSTKYNVLITPENYNTTLGVVKTIRNNLKATHEIFVCEMGATHVGDIKEICNIVHPKYGIITSIGPQHLESFGTIENVIKTKFELVDSLPKDDGIAFLNYNNEYIRNNKIDKKYVSYGIENANCDYNAYNLKSDSHGIIFNVKKENEDENSIDFRSKVIGNHNIENITGAIALANILGISLEKLSLKVRQIEPVEHRLQVLSRGNDIIIDDAYNSNPIGSISAINALATFDGIKILVTPGMIELGEKEYECNYNFGEYASKKCDYIKNKLNQYQMQ